MQFSRIQSNACIAILAILILTGLYMGFVISPVLDHPMVVDSDLLIAIVTGCLLYTSPSPRD